MSVGYIGGVPFDGFERGWEMTIDRHIEVIDVVGSRPRLIPLFPTAATDEVDLSAEIWVNGTNAALIESTLPPKGAASTVNLLLQGIPSVAAVAGFGTYSSDNWRLFGCVLTAPVTSLGRKAVRVDLFGYGLQLRFAANAYGLGGASGNERSGAAPTDTTVPAILSRKFSAHQIQDPSVMRSPVPLGSGAAFPVVVHGRRLDATIQLDHMTEAEATAVCNWFRAIRATPFNVTAAQLFGPGMPSTVSAVATKLTMRRGSGNWWEADLSLSYAGPST